jgi:predicted ATPase/class 3 adenylate cyclase
VSTRAPGAPDELILTPDQRVRVFISSTLEELAEERAAARRAIRRLHLAPVWYESGARPHPPRSMYQAYVDQSHVFVGIYWQRYGWVAPGMDISGLEDEYRLAKGKPMLLYLKRPAPEQEPRLSELIDAIRASGVVSYRSFTTPKELERLLAEDLAVLLSEHFRSTLVPAVPTEGSGAAPVAAAADLPTGTVTFVFTDIEGSTRLWERAPGAMAQSLALHNAALELAFQRHEGSVFSTMGDGMAVAFRSAVAATAAVCDAQRGLRAVPWPAETGALMVRMGVHTDEGQLRDGQYLNQPLNRCARIMAAAHGGQVLLSEATVALVRAEVPERASFLDLGQHRLRDLPGPVHLFQLVHPDLPVDFPALRSLQQPGNLPLQLTSFIGRQSDLSAVSGALREGRLVTLTGPGGVGKTRLAIEAATQSVHGYRDGCWLCELASAGDGESALQLVASTLGVSPRAALSVQESIVDFGRSKEMLIVLDNCEHVIGEAGVLTDAVLRGCVDVRVLATSRQELDIEGERVLRLSALAVADADAPIDVITGSDAVRLFVDRAVAVSHDFVLDGPSAPAVAEISRRLDGMPLAIELAAARVAAMSPVQIAELLDDRFRLLTKAWRTAADRHQTLRATVDWSFSLLTADEQGVFAGLGVFVGSFDADAVMAVVRPGEDRWTVLEALASLVSKSMVVREEGAPGVVVAGAGPRYRLLETLRQYAEERLEEGGDAALLRRRLAQHEAEFAEAAAPALRGPDELAWRPRLRAELDALRASVQWALGSEDDSDGELAVRIAAALASYAVFEAAGDIASFVERAVPRARRSTPGRRTAVLGSAAFAALMNKGDIVLAEDLCREALRDGDIAGAPDPHSAYAALTIALAWTGRTEEAKRLCAEGLAALASNGADDYSRVLLLQTASTTALATGDSDGAQASAFEALRVARGVANPSELCVALWAASLATAVELPGESLDFAEEAIALIRAGASGAVLGYVLAIRAQHRAEDGDMVGSLADLREAVVFSREKGDQIMLTVCVDRAVIVLSRLGRAEPVAVLTGMVERSGPGGASIVPGGGEEERTHAISQARAALGPEAFDAAARRGAAMQPDAVVAYLVAELDRLGEQAG